MTARIFDLAAVRHPVRTWVASFAWPRDSAEIPPPVDVHGMMPPLSQRVALLQGCGRVHVSVDPEFIPAECTWCQLDRPRITSVRVYGDPRRPQPRRLGMSTLREAAVCLQCALGVADLATAPGRRVGALGQVLAEARPNAVILVEVCE